MKNISLILISVGFFYAGTMHFTDAQSLAAITPLPYALEIVWLTGVMELIFPFFLLWPTYRQVTGIWLSAFCLAVLAANINMAINDIPMFGQPVEPWIAWLRLPMQFVLIAWIIYACESMPLIKKYRWRAFFHCQ
tara:strand:+ start:1156 stop:1560 length:405 start_codon:yes stop_codon:yes gene_type:complete